MSLAIVKNLMDATMIQLLMMGLKECYQPFSHQWYQVITCRDILENYYTDKPEGDKSQYYTDKPQRMLSLDQSPMVSDDDMS